MRMLRIGLPLALLLLATTACKRSRPQPTVDTVEGEGTAYQVRFGDSDDVVRLPFRIEAIHRGAKPKGAPPWHEPGGTWTFFDAQTRDGVRFGFGFEDNVPGNADGEEDTPFRFSKGMLTVPDAAEGAKLVEAVRRVFKGAKPEERARNPLRIEPISIALLGTNVGRTARGFSGTGTWAATKLFLQRPGIEAEVFFNFDLTSKEGEFSEKDGDYADDLLAFLAAELRDGPIPDRTPETDPQISATGPKLDPFRPIAPEGSTLLKFEPGSPRALVITPEGGDNVLYSVPLERPDERVELARTRDRIGAFECGSGSEVCVLEQSTPTRRGTWSSEDPTSFLLVDRATRKARPLAGAWGTKGGLASAPVSPGGAYVAITEWKKKSATEPGAYRAVHFVPTAASENAATKEAGASIDLRGVDADVVAWTGRREDLRAIVREGGTLDPKNQRYAVVDPRTGARKALPGPPGSVQTDDSLSPDGKRRVRCVGAKAIVVTDVATGAARRFDVHASDQRAIGSDCVGWASRRYLAYHAGRPAFLDSETMKLSYPFARGEEPPGLSYDATLTWAIASDASGIKAARVVVR
jgi:hypothetical protein